MGATAALLALLIATGVANARETTKPAPRTGPNASISERQATRALQRVESLIAGTSAEPARELTIALRDLAIALPALKGSARQAAGALLARPTDGVGDPLGDGYSAPTAAFRSSCTTHLCVHWVISTGDAPDLADLDPANGNPDYVDAVLSAAETSYSVQIEALDWKKPVSDGGRGGNSKTDIYLKNIGGDGLFGYAAPDPGQGSKRSQFGYLVIDNDYRASEFPGYASPTEPMNVTVAHEYNHILQFAYDTLQEAWLFESTATWMEEHVFGEIDDYVDVFIPEFTRRPQVPLTDPDTDKIYGDAVWHHFLSKKFDPSVSRDVWANSTNSDPKDFAIGAFGNVLKERGSSFSRQFARFAPATAEWKATNVFPDTYPDVKRKGTLGIDQSKRKKLDHTAYVLYDVDIASIATQARADRLKLVVKTNRSAHSGLAIVARKGGATKGKVKTRIKYLKRGGRGAVTLKNFEKFDRITAVVVNADGRVKGHSGLDFAYTRDNVRYEAKLKLG